MGSSQSTPDAAIHRAIDEIEKQRSEIVEVQEENVAQATRLHAMAQQAFASGAKAIAVLHMRRRRQLLRHMDGIAGIVETLDAHRNALETKLITSRTMDVMRTTAVTLSRNMADINNADSLMMDGDETLDALSDLTSALSTCDGDTDDDLLLALEQSASSTIDELAELPKVPAKELAVPIRINDDAAFVENLEMEVARLMLPDAPTHELPDVHPRPPPYACRANIATAPGSAAVLI